MTVIFILFNAKQPGQLKKIEEFHTYVSQGLTNDNIIIDIVAMMVSTNLSHKMQEQLTEVKEWAINNVVNYRAVSEN